MSVRLSVAMPWAIRASLRSMSHSRSAVQRSGAANTLCASNGDLATRDGRSDDVERWVQLCRTAHVAGVSQLGDYGCDDSPVLASRSLRTSLARPTAAAL